MKRMRFIIPILIVASLLVMTFTGCLPSAPKTPVTTKSSEDDKQNTRLDNLETLIKQKVGTDTSDALLKRIKDLEAGTAGTNSYSKSETYTKAEVNDAITDAVQALKDDQDWIEASSSSSSSSSVTESQLVDTDGDLKLYIKDVDPGSEPAYLHSGKDSIEFDFIVKNTSDDNHRYRLNFRLTPVDSVKVTAPDNADIRNSTTTALVIYPNVLGNFTATRSDWDTTANTSPIYFNQATNRFIDDDDEEDVRVIITVDSDAGTEWNYRITIEEYE